MNICNLITATCLLVLLFPLDSNAIGPISELRGIKLQLLSGEVLTGHMRYDDAVYEYYYNGETVTDVVFPEMHLDPIEGFEVVCLYEELHSIVYPVNGFIVASREPRLIPYDSIQTVDIWLDSLERQRATNIPVLSPGIIELLKNEPPLAYRIGETEHFFVVYWLSYSSRVGDEELEILCSEPWIWLVEMGEIMEQWKVIRLEYYWD
ncbi:MAG: hypothetical protein KAT09_07645 [Candidatus Aegiribacteria sp.]|nr:hypothetical protein [Candidatus Aegiribacteria sp.]